MRTVLALASLLLLGGCLDSTPEKPTIALVTGPKFAESRFQCGRQHPIPPDLKSVPDKDVDTAASNFIVLDDAWGRSCRDPLRSLYAELKAAGQVLPTKAPKK